MARKREQCLCGLAFGDTSKPVICGHHHDEVVRDRDAWKVFAEEITRHLENCRKLRNFGNKDFMVLQQRKALLEWAMIVLGNESADKQSVDTLKIAIESHLKGE